MALPKALYLLYKNAPPCFICVYCTKSLLEMQGQLPFDVLTANDMFILYNLPPAKLLKCTNCKFIL